MVERLFPWAFGAVIGAGLGFLIGVGLGFPLSTAVGDSALAFLLTIPVCMVLEYWRPGRG